MFFKKKNMKYFIKKMCILHVIYVRNKNVMNTNSRTKTTIRIVYTLRTRPI